MKTEDMTVRAVHDQYLTLHQYFESQDFDLGYCYVDMMKKSGKLVFKFSLRDTFIKPEHRRDYSGHEFNVWAHLSLDDEFDLQDLWDEYNRIPPRSIRQTRYLAWVAGQMGGILEENFDHGPAAEFAARIKSAMDDMQVYLEHHEGEL